MSIMLMRINSYFTQFKITISYVSLKFYIMFLSDP